MGKIDGRQYVSTYARVQLHSVKLSRRQRPRFVQNIFRYSQLSHVMKEGCRFYRTNLSTVAYADSTCKAHRVVLNATDMAMRDLIFGIDRHRQRLNGRHI